MDIVRVVKLKILMCDELSNDKERYFYSLFNNLTIFNQPETTFYFVKVIDEKDHESNEHYFHYHTFSRNLWCSRINVIEPFMKKFNIENVVEAAKELKALAKDLKVENITSSIKTEE